MTLINNRYPLPLIATNRRSCCHRRFRSLRRRPCPLIVHGWTDSRSRPTALVRCQVAAAANKLARLSAWRRHENRGDQLTMSGFAVWRAVDCDADSTTPWYMLHPHGKFRCVFHASPCIYRQTVIFHFYCARIPWYNYIEQTVGEF